LFEGGGRGRDNGDKKIGEADKVKQLFHQTDILGQDHLKKVGEDL